MRFLSFVIAFLLLGASPVMANGTNWYLEGTASYQFSGDLDRSGGTVSPGPTRTVMTSSSSSSIGYDNGFLVGLAIGGLLANSISAELELTHSRRDAERYSDELTATALMVNAYYNFQLANAVTGYFGGGLGGVNLENDNGSSTYDDTVLAYQLMVGFAYAVNAVTLFTEYRYQASNDADFNGFDQEFNSHNIGVGVRFPIN